MTQPDIQPALDNLIAVLRAGLRAELIASLSSTPTPRVAKANGAQPSTPRKATRTKGAKRGAAELDALVVQLRAYIARNPGQRIETIGKAMSVATKDLSLPVKKLIANGKLKTRGQKRATAYFVKS